MAQAGQGVKLGVERHGASFSILELGSEGSAQVVGTACDVEALLLEEVGEDLVGVDLLVADLRVLPDLQVSLELITLPNRADRGLIWETYLLVDGLQSLILTVDGGEDLISQAIGA